MQVQLIELADKRCEYRRFAECRMGLCECVGAGAARIDRAHQGGGDGLFGHDETGTEGEPSVDRNASFEQAFAGRFTAGVAAARVVLRRGVAIGTSCFTPLPHAAVVHVATIILLVSKAVLTR